MRKKRKREKRKKDRKKKKMFLRWKRPSERTGIARSKKETSKKEKGRERAGVRTKRNAALSPLAWEHAQARIARVHTRACGKYKTILIP